VIFVDLGFLRYVHDGFVPESTTYYLYPFIVRS